MVLWKMKTYEEIRAYIKLKDNRYINSCWIAQVKREMGYMVSKAHNSGRKTKKFQDWARPLIKEAIEKLK